MYEIKKLLSRSNVIKLLGGSTAIEIRDTVRKVM